MSKIERVTGASQNRQSASQVSQFSDCVTDVTDFSGKSDSVRQNKIWRKARHIRHTRSSNVAIRNFSIVKVH